MHTSQYGPEWVFLHNGDYSGDVTICNSLIPAGQPALRIQIPFDELLQFVADFVRQKEITRLEQESALDILGIIE